VAFFVVACFRRVCALSAPSNWEKEDNERVRRLEEEIEKGRQKRLARRAEGELSSFLA
jgi:hypothetical protein